MPVLTISSFLLLFTLLAFLAFALGYVALTTKYNFGVKRQLPLAPVPRPHTRQLSHSLDLSLGTRPLDVMSDFYMAMERRRMREEKDIEDQLKRIDVQKTDFKIIMPPRAYYLYGSPTSKSFAIPRWSKSVSPKRALLLELHSPKSITPELQSPPAFTESISQPMVEKFLAPDSPDTNVDDPFYAASYRILGPPGPRTKFPDGSCSSPSDASIAQSDDSQVAHYPPHVDLSPSPSPELPPAERFRTLYPKLSLFSFPSDARKMKKDPVRRPVFFWRTSSSSNLLPMYDAC
ncbi:hypothetical protein C8J56DRAFT_207836 [Mycena floridula]|nr:hypothetical protein C8J56DRAFT_207836 [Mycena floridula]